MYNVCMYWLGFMKYEYHDFITLKNYILLTYYKHIMNLYIFILVNISINSWSFTSMLKLIL